MPDDVPPLKHFVYERLRTMIVSGFYSKKEIFETIESEIGASPELEAETAKFRGYAAKQWTLQEIEEHRWSERTTNDELDDAFSSLNQRGIVALQNAGWTNSEGWEDAWSRRETLLAQGQEPRGAVFYHYQSLERGVAGEGLWLNFGIFHEQDDGDLAANGRLAEEVCKALQDHGVAASWNGDPREKILVHPFSWRKRRKTTAPARPGPWHRFHHPDGRRWEARRCGSELELRITPTDEDGKPCSSIRRLRKFPTQDEAQATLKVLLEEQRAEGFQEDPPDEAPTRASRE